MAIEKSAIEESAILEREFFRNARGPAAADIDIWRLILDEKRANLLVRHEWRTERHSGIDDFTVGEFLLLEGAARDALLAVLFPHAETAKMRK